MPRSKNRRYLEIPATLYDELAVQAAAEQRPVAAVVADLVTDGRTVREYLVPMQTEMRAIRAELEALRYAVENRLPPWGLPSSEQSPQLPSNGQGKEAPSKEPRSRKAPRKSAKSEQTQPLPSSDHGAQIPSNKEVQQLPSSEQLVSDQAQVAEVFDDTLPPAEPWREEQTAEPMEQTQPLPSSEQGVQLPSNG